MRSGWPGPSAHGGREVPRGGSGPSPGRCLFRCLAELPLSLPLELKGPALSGHSAARGVSPRPPGQTLGRKRSGPTEAPSSGGWGTCLHQESPPLRSNGSGRQPVQPQGSEVRRASPGRSRHVWVPLARSATSLTQSPDWPQDLRKAGGPTCHVHGSQLAGAAGAVVRERGPPGVWGSGPYSPDLATDKLLEGLEMEEHPRGHSPLLPASSPRVSRSFHEQAAGTMESGGGFCHRVSSATSQTRGSDVKLNINVTRSIPLGSQKLGARCVLPLTPARSPTSAPPPGARGLRGAPGRVRSPLDADCSPPACGGRRLRGRAEPLAAAAAQRGVRHSPLRHPDPACLHRQGEAQHCVTALGGEGGHRPRGQCHARERPGCRAPAGPACGYGACHLGPRCLSPAQGPTRDSLLHCTAGSGLRPWRPPAPNAAPPAPRERLGSPRCGPCTQPGRSPGDTPPTDARGASNAVQLRR